MIEKALRIRLTVFGEAHADVATSYNNVGVQYCELGDLRKGVEYRKKALEIAHSINDTYQEASLQNQVGTVLVKLGETGQAREHFQHSAELFKELGNEQRYEIVMDRIRSLPPENNS